MLEILLATKGTSSSGGGGVGPGGDTGPGPTTLLGSNATAGFYGEITAANFITGDALAAAIGLTDGLSMNSTTNWLKFFIDNKILFIPKKPIRNAFLWDSIYKAGAVYGDGTFGKYPTSTNKLQNTKVTVAGYIFIVRLMTGFPADPSPINTVDTATVSEWNRLIYNVCDSPQPKANQIGVNWAHYLESDLNINTNVNLAGVYTWTQETMSNAAGKGLRGSPYVSSVVYGFTTTAYATCGWRPVLELVGKA